VARARKRDWPQLVYKYAVADCQLPQQMWDTARAMQDLWCELARAHEEVRNRVKAENPTTAEKKAMWDEFRETAAAMTKAAPLNWECGPEVLTRFEACCRRANSTRDGGWPRVQGLQSVSIPHRYTSGGAPLPLLTSERATRFRLTTLGTGLVSGTFGLGAGESIAFRAVVHRQIPDGAIVKKVTWCGRRSVFGWKWAVAITVEVPHSAPRVRTGSVAAVDVGWRLLKDPAGDQVRVAYVLARDGDREQHWEYCLPLTRSNRNIRRHNERFPDRRIPTSYEELRDLQQQIDRAKDAVKATIRELVTPLPDGFVQMGRKGLLRLYHELRQLDSAHPAFAPLAEWAARDLAMLKRHVAAQEQFVAKRRWLYQNWAADLARRYDYIVIEGNLSVKDLIEEPKKKRARGEPVDHAVEAGLRYHQIAATGEFVATLKQAAAKYGCTIVQGDATGTTSICHECGGLVEPGPKRELVCEAGHRHDQDYNACRNLFAQLANPDGWEPRLVAYRQRMAQRRAAAAT
jgi:hypothetical protein